VKLIRCWLKKYLKKQKKKLIFLSCNSLTIKAFNSIVTFDRIKTRKFSISTKKKNNKNELLSLFISLTVFVFIVYIAAQGLWTLFDSVYLNQSTTKWQTLLSFIRNSSSTSTSTSIAIATATATSTSSMCLYHHIPNNGINEG